MAFSTTRGRPRNSVQGRDFGTDELRAKRQRQHTLEPLDRLLQQGRISEQQHWCGVHLRWLHAVLYGVAAPRQLVWLERAHTLRQDDEEWLAARKEEYKVAQAAINRERVWQVTAQWCLYAHVLEEGGCASTL